MSTLGRRSGFTIIETMMFLAITGVLVIALMAGTGASITFQRYRDSLVSLQSKFQDQYSYVANVENAPVDQAWKCESGAVVSVGDSSTFRGQGDCQLLGRYIKTIDNRTLSIEPVVGYSASAVQPGTTDVDVLKTYALRTLPYEQENYAVEWNNALMQAGGNNPSSFSMLIVSSPSSGIIRTFIDPTTAVASNNISSLINDANLRKDLKLCVDGGIVIGTSRMAVQVNQGATSATAVETFGDGASGC